MNFETYLNQAWNDHATQTIQVVENFPQALALVENADQLIQLAGLVTHVMGEHLGQWSEGIKVLEQLKGHSAFVLGSEADQALQRSIASLKVGSGDSSVLESFSISDQIRILTVAASALSERALSSSLEAFQRALKLADSGLDAKDPANRSLAITGNNLASTFEQKKDRSSEETRFMVLAAQAARKYWELAGTWVHVERAEYRLAMSFLQAKDLSQALEHAKKCLEICKNNQAEPLEFFFGFEVLALVEMERKNTSGFAEALAQVKENFHRLSADDQSWCQSTLTSLESNLQ